MTKSLTLVIKPATTLAQIFPEIAKNTAVADELLAGQIINITDEPIEQSWALLPMYNIDQNGKERIWQIGFDHQTQSVISIHGQVGGKIQREPPKEVITRGGKNVTEQALIEARYRYTLKWRKGYRPRGENQATRLAAQCANFYKPPGQPGKGTSNIKFPVAVQAKLDGIRVRVWLENNQIVTLTRENNSFKFFQAHKANLLGFFAYLPPNAGLDGEWYNHEMNFDEISGISRRRKNQDARENELKMYIFDLIMPGKTTEERFSLLIRALQAFWQDGNQNEYFELLNITWAYNHEEIMDFHNQYVRAGYEGLMIRKTAQAKSKLEETYYRGKRNNNLLKYKSFDEDEGIVVEVTEGQGREKSLAMFMVQDKKEQIFPVRPKGSFQWREKCFQHPQTCIGRLYTYQYQELTPKGLPRFPRGKAFRDKKDKPGVLAY